MFKQDFQTYFSKHRLYFMGIAMICVMLFHQKFLEGRLFDFFHACGHWGVDLFLVVSGFGIAHSLMKNSRIEYYRHRVRRLLPSCLIFGCVSFGFALVSHGVEMPRRLLVMTPLSLNQWYITAIVLFYSLAPFILPFVQKWKLKTLVVIIPVCFLAKAIDLSFLWPIDWAIERFPAFVFGMILYCSSKWNIGCRYVLISLSLVVLLSWFVAEDVRFFSSQTYRYLIFLFIIPAFCYFCGCLELLTDKLNISVCVKWVGRLSLQIYLAHVFCFDLVLKHVVDTPPILQFLLAIGFSFLYAYVVYKFVNLIKYD